jgi:UDP-N-acetylmuramyl pentapeptide phosphotransferase/UDP-N-acetylglucosamine-1-phosphate transferase
MLELTDGGLRLLALVIMASATLAAALIVVLRPLLVRYAMARPNFRSSHIEPTPQGGGIAVVTAALSISALVLFASQDRSNDLLLVFGGAFALAAVGAIDDVRALPASLRLLLHAASFALVLLALPAELRIASFLPFWLERALLLVAGIWIVNLVNFMDGIDWMTVAEFIPITAALGVIGFIGGLPDHAVLVALALLGALIGFAPFNKPVARLFLGDVGSLPLGLLLGWLLVLLAGRGHLAAALILPLYYFADASITLLRRLARGERVWQAHRTHFYQRATDNGFSVPQIVRMVFLTNLALVALALFSVAVPSLVAQLATAASAAALVFLLLRRLASGPTRR